MLDWRKLGIIAVFEVSEALRSRLVLVVLSMFGLGAALGAWVFVEALDAAEQAARRALEETLQVPAHAIPADLVREKALPGLIAAFVEQEELRQELLEMDPMAIFYGFMSLNLVALLVLVISGGTLANDINTGSVRFVLTRCSRLSWFSGKLLGHWALLALGLATGAVAASFVASVHRHDFELSALGWLLKTSLWAWLYGVPFLTLFGMLQVLTSSPLAARALGLMALFLLSILYAITQSSWLGATSIGLSKLGYLFAAHYEPLLWSPRFMDTIVAITGLFALAAIWFIMGYWLLRRRDT